MCKKHLKWKKGEKNHHNLVPYWIGVARERRIGDGSKGRSLKIGIMFSEKGKSRGRAG